MCVVLEVGGSFWEYNFLIFCLVGLFCWVDRRNRNKYINGML